MCRPMTIRLSKLKIRVISEAKNVAGEYFSEINFSIHSIVFQLFVCNFLIAETKPKSLSMNKNVEKSPLKVKENEQQSIVEREY